MLDVFRRKQAAPVTSQHRIGAAMEEAARRVAFMSKVGGPGTHHVQNMTLTVDGQDFNVTIAHIE